MGLFSLLSLLTNTVYPVIASCRAYDDYTRVASLIASQNLKIAGITVPIGLIFDTIKATTTEDKSSNDGNAKITPEMELQRHLISIQKWFIYWVVISVVSVFENIIFLYLLPGYSIIKLAFGIWLIFPMILASRGEMEPDSVFDNTKEWKSFTETGAGLLFFKYIKPGIENNRDNLNEIINNPIQSLHLKEVTNYFPVLSKFTKSSNNEKSTSQPESGLLDSSFVMVMNMKNKLTGNTANVSPEEKVPDEFDIIETAPEEIKDSTVTKRKGWW